MTVQYRMDILRHGEVSISGEPTTRDSARAQLRDYEARAKERGHTLVGEGTDWVLVMTGTKDGAAITHAAAVTAIVPDKEA